MSRALEIYRLRTNPANVGLSDADFLAQTNTPVVVRVAPVVGRVVVKEYMLANMLWPRLEIAATGSQGPDAQGVAQSAIAYLNDAGYPTIDFTSPLGMTIMGGLVATSVFTQIERDTMTAALTQTLAAPCDLLGGPVVQDELVPLERFGAIEALALDNASVYNVNANYLDVLRNDLTKTVPLDLTALHAAGAI